MPRPQPARPGPAPDPERRVPVQFIGLARDLRRRIIAADATFEQQSNTLLQPLRPRPGFTPMPRHDMLRALAADWRRLPALGRLRVVAVFDADQRKLQIVELRVRANTLTAPGWSEPEPALAVVLHSVAIQPPAFNEQRSTMAAIGLHALARRFQRGPDRTPAAVLDDLVPLARGSVRASRLGGEFAIPAANGAGRWIGACRAGDNAIVVRTFVNR